MSREVQNKLRHLHRKRVMHYCLHMIAWSGGITGLSAAFMHLLTIHDMEGLVWVAIVSVLLFGALHLPHNYLSYRALIDCLHKSHPELEHSLHFLRVPNSTVFYRLLYERIEPRLAAIDTVPYPYARRSWMWWSGLCLLSCLFIWAVHGRPSVKATTKEAQEPVVAALDTGRLSVAAEWTVFPPAYTGKTAARETKEHFQLIEGSSLHVKVSASDSLQKAYLLFNFTDTLFLRRNTPCHYSLHWQPEKSGLYQLQLLYQDSLFIADARQMTLLPDSLPRGYWLSLTQTDIFVPYRPGKEPAYQWILEATDDFGIESIQATLTIARGTGEQVSFYEKALPLSITVLNKRHQRASLHLAPLEWGAAWGDEVFVSVWVRDNKKPVSQVTQLPVLRLTMEDTSAQVLAAEGFGVGVNRLPEYFRSQRQIIIDTEELLRVHKQLPEAAFRQRSQNIAFDQKALRMRYGKFLGEEDYLAASPTTKHEETTEEADDEHHGHEHEEHHHEGHEHAEGEQADLLAAYRHVHDLSEINTFLDPATRDTLKKALAAMWESEKYLRLAKPQQALPYQYEALKYLKMVQQKSRVYVRKSGIDLPPLSEEYRLSKAGEVPQAPRRRLLPLPATIPSYARLAEWWQVLWLSHLTGKPLSALQLQQLSQTIMTLPASEEQKMELIRQVGALQRRPACVECRQHLLKTLFQLLQQPALPQRPLSRTLQIP
ncbi:MAG: membrane protein [Thermonema sp.]|uniref:hypothetical protein n=1 Tax=Thermonema sp. TaxID=2231181 RepID=UPI0021DE7686|nr:hypothetical protein [Thermonema sp.]GIV39789.1 MAG: membrane protein [Thermonema sp.]